MTEYVPRRAIISGAKNDKGSVDIPDDAIIVETNFRSPERPNLSFKIEVIWLHPVV